MSASTVTSARRDPPGRHRLLAGRPAMGVRLGMAAAGSLGCGLALVGASRTPMPVASDVGLVAVLPAIYWVGLAVVCLAFGVALAHHARCTWLHVTLLAALVLSVYGAAAVASGVPRGEVAWRHIGITMSLAQTGAIDADIDAYFSWPGFFALVASLPGVSQDSLVQVALWAPVWNMALWLAALAWLLSALTDDPRRVWLALWLFSLGNWIDQDYLSPQAFGFFVHLVALTLVLRYLDPVTTVREPVGPQRRFAFLAVVLLAAALVASHQLTPFLLLAAVTALVCARRCVARNLPLVVALMIGCWLAFPASSYLIGHPLFPPATDALSANLGDRLPGSPGHELANRVRMLLTACLWGLALLGGLRDRWLGRLDTRAALLAVVPFVLVPVQPYGGEMLMRVTLFALPFVAFLAAGCVLGVTRRGWVGPLVAAVCAVLVVGSVTARYANARFDTFTHADIDASRALYAMADNGDFLIAGAHPTPWSHMDYTDHRHRTLTELCPPESTATQCAETVFDRIDHQGTDAWIMLSSSHEASLTMQGGLSQGALDGLEQMLRDRSDVDLRFRNASVRIYHLDAEVPYASAGGA